MKTAKVVLAIFLLLLLAGSSPVFASDGSHGSHGSSQTLSLTLSGGILNSGTQRYSHEGGDVVAAYLAGAAIDMKDSEFHQSLHAVVNGLEASGQATFSLTAKSDGGASIEIEGSAPINSMAPAEFFPFTCVTPKGEPTKDCTSGIPGLFFGNADVTIKTCQGEDQSQGGGDQSQGGDQTQNGGVSSQDGNDHNNDNCKVQSMTTPMQFESAFLNPFGGPIFLSSVDQSLLIIATYSEARVTWAGIQMGGFASGQLSGTPVSGNFAMVVAATEDLKEGTESDHGSIIFSGMSAPSLNAAGTFHGESTIPPGFDCSATAGFPPGTCQLTGFHSSGDFSQKNGSGGKIKGDYSTEWSVPAVAFVSTVTATLT